MNTLIKLCGFKHIDDISFAASLDINYLGMIFVENLPRTIDITTAQEAVNICKTHKIKSVGVFLNQDVSAIESVLSSVDLDVIQLHGNENVDVYKKLGKEIIKTIHVTDNIYEKINTLNFDGIDYLLDTSSKQMMGGTGMSFDWKILETIPSEKLFIAGGLKPDNILDLLNISRPKCLDVSSGIEKNIGHKDKSLMKDFVAKIRAYK